MNPKRGHVWWADLGIAAKVRPVLVISSDFRDEDYALITVIPHTTSPRGSSFEVSLKVPNLKEGAFNTQGLLSVPPRIFERHIATLTDEQMVRVEKALKDWLHIG